jgi:hypothetical protein
MMPASPASDLQANILKVLSAGGPPLTPPKIARALPVGGRPPLKLLRSLLAQMAAAGRLERLPGKTDRYIAAPAEAWARSTLLEMLRFGPQTGAKLEKSLTVHHAHLATDLLAALIDSGQVFRHPAPSKAGKSAFALTPPDPLPYLAGALDRLQRAVEEKGFAPAAVRAAVLRHLGASEFTSAARGAGDADAKATPKPAPKNAAGLSPETVVEAMGRVEPRVNDGAAVPIARLRDMLGAQHDKKSFDEAMLLLAARGIIELQSHAWPARLTAEQQKLLIDDGHGGWFDSAALQRRKGS